MNLPVLLLDDFEVKAAPLVDSKCSGDRVKESEQISRRFNERDGAQQRGDLVGILSNSSEDAAKVAASALKSLMRKAGLGTLSDLLAQIP